MKIIGSGEFLDWKGVGVGEWVVALRCGGGGKGAWRRWGVACV